MPVPRIAIVGFAIESNSFAPVVGEPHFAERALLRGAAILDDARSARPTGAAEVTGFLDGMDATGAWITVPVLFADGAAAGPVAEPFFRALLDEAVAGLGRLGPVDGVYCPLHGAALTDSDLDPEATLLAALRRVLGPGVPIVATLDLHANVTQAMVQSADVLVAYLTNPHVDMAARGREAAGHMRALLAGERFTAAFRRVPIVAPTVALLTARGPYAEVIALGQERARADPRIANVSVCGGFPYADIAEPGPTVVVTTRGDATLADALADELARELWARRARFVANLTPLAEATQRMLAVARDPTLLPLCFADVADNPGGGGLGNTANILAAFAGAGVEGTVFAVHHEPALAAQAHSQGLGARFEATFGAGNVTLPVEVMHLSPGRMLGRRGMLAGRAIDLGASARLRCRGLDVIVVSIRQQCADPVMVEHFGLDLAALRGLVVKSRGHFRAGFDEVFDDGRIVEVDAPGLTSPMLDRVPYRHLKRPVMPFDPAMTWTPR